jgi:hypothetical protein
VAAVFDERKRRDSQAGRSVLTRWAFSRVGQTLILSTYGDHASEEELGHWLARMAQHDFTRMLVHAQGASLTAKQRARIADFWNKSGRPLPRVAVLTDSTTERAILTALVWLLQSQTKDIKAFALSNIDAAVQWLGEAQGPALIAEEIASLQAALRAKQTPSARPDSGADASRPRT